MAVTLHAFNITEYSQNIFLVKIKSSTVDCFYSIFQSNPSERQEQPASFISLTLNSIQAMMVHRTYVFQRRKV